MTSRINRSLDQDSSSSSSADEDGSQDVLSLLMGVFHDHNDETSPQVWAPYSCAHVSGSPSLHRRDVVPSHFLLKIESFASLSKSPITHYRSEFEAGGYNWTEFCSYVGFNGREISIFPNGDKTNGGEDHISVFLRLIDTNLPIGWEIREQYVTSQGTFVSISLKDANYEGEIVDNANVLRFHAMKTKWSIIKYIDLKTFNDSSNGFLVNGSCAFGAEIFVVKNTIKGECLTMIEDPIKCTNTWKIGDFSAITQDRHASQPFLGGDYIWYICYIQNDIFILKIIYLYIDK
ncbi:hypothetical protein G4B88_017770 [Cannabis sativa]|uniref:MATH domain-containing protein n=1 Tax=Cannabis sativa TaxID=3483 RepID=A0A7J6I5G4_CANSA|nr:hypothetical protein G4B88_017770 [Cannabis sativa]